LKLSHYKTLGVSDKASPEEIKKAYRSLAKKYHPDKTANNSVAETRFKEVSLAYSVLSSPQRRAEYDAQRLAGSWFQPFRNFEDIFQTKKKKEPIVHNINLKIKDFEKGELEQTVRLNKSEICKPCKGQGVLDPKLCQSCRGSGVIRNTREFGNMKINDKTNCTSCSGKGIVGIDTCKSCAGKGKLKNTENYKIEIRIRKK
jgi:molecular chaperone DnaJ